MISMDELTEIHWKSVHKIAEKIAEEQFKIDPKGDGIQTELKKILSYFLGQLRAKSVTEEALGNYFFTYLDVLKRNSDDLGYGKHNTSRYYSVIQRVCKENIIQYQREPKTFLAILSWSARLIRYYKSNNYSPKSESRSQKKFSDKRSKTTMAAAFEKLGFKP